jgi:hypothetical protein
MTIFHFKDTPENRAHADAINGIMKRKADLAKAETTHMKSKAALPLLLGGSAFALCLGVGGGVALWGYSYITGNKVIAGQVAESVKAVLDTTTIHGTVSGEVGMKDGIVRLDQSSALVRVIGQAPDMPRQQPEQVRQDERPASQAAVKTEFTVFKTVPFGAGEVESAWVYQSSAQQTPSEQYCQYLGPANAGAYAVTILGRDGRIDLPATAPAGVDLRAAAALCDWKADSAKTAPVAPVAPVQTILVHAAKR